MLELFSSVVLVLCALFPLNVSAGVPRFANFSGAYDLTCSGTRFCGRELFLRIIDTQLTNLTIDGTEYGGKQHCDVRNLSMSLIDVNKTSNLNSDDRGFMIVPKEGTFVVCGEEKLGITLKQKPDGVRYVSLIVNVDHGYLTGRFGNLTGYSFDSLKPSNNTCQYKGRSANLVRATATDLGWLVVKSIMIAVASFPIICALSIFIRVGLESYGYSIDAHDPEKIFFLIFPVCQYILFLFEKLSPLTANGRVERSPFEIFAIFVGGFAGLLATYSTIVGGPYLIRALVWYKSRLESNTADLAVGWIIGIGAGLASLPFFGSFGAIVFGLAFSEATARCVIRSRRFLTRNDVSHI